MSTNIYSIPEKEWELIGNALVLVIDALERRGEIMLSTEYSNALFELESRRSFLT